MMALYTLFPSLFAIPEEKGCDFESFPLNAAIHFRLAPAKSGRKFIVWEGFQSPIVEIVLQHHERMNGTGYPKGLCGQDILPEARIIAVADVVEAISSHRPYRPALGIDTALQEITKNRGILYDSEVVDVCLRLFTERDYRFQT